MQAQHGEVAQWGETEYLLAGVIDQLAAANWQRAQAGSKSKIPRPKPVRRPGDKPRGVRYGSVTLPADDVKALLRSFDPQPEEAANA